MFRKEDGTIDMAAVLGTVMIACALYILGYATYVVAPRYELLLTHWSFGDTSSAFLLMFCGIAVLAAKGMEYSSRVAIASLAVGLTFMLRNTEFTEFYGEYVSFVVSVVSFILGVVAVTASMALLFKYRFYSSRVLMAVAVMILVECVPMYMHYHNMFSWDLIFYVCGASFGYIAADAVLVIALRADDIRVPSTYEKIERSMKPVRDQLYSDADTYITPEDASVLERLVLAGEGKAEIRLRSRKSSRVLSVEGREGQAPRATVVTEDGRSFVEGFSMDICSVVSESDCIKAYGRNGVFIRILVHPEPEKPDVKGRIPFISDLKRDPEEEAKD